VGCGLVWGGGVVVAAGRALSLLDPLRLVRHAQELVTAATPDTVS
jgi:hypothetical protein